jgi:glycosyltransferase involved in cell wall biosynthesis
MQIAIVIPALNEERTLGETIKQFHREIPEAKIWVVDNGSTDNTAALADSVIQSLGSGGGVIKEPSRGKGNAVRRGFQLIDADVFLMVDADMTYPASKARELILPCVRGEADMVVGDRISEGSYSNTKTRRFHGLGNQLVSFLVNRLYGSELKDVMSGYRAFTRSFVKNYPILVDGFQIETDLTLHALDKRFRIMEVPVNYVDRPQGSESKLSTFSDGTRVITTIIRIFRMYKPFVFFGTGAFLMGVTSLLVGFPVVQEWFATGLVLKVPSAVLATGLGIFSLVLFTVALILDSLSHNERRFFELRLIDSQIQKPNREQNSGPQE